MKRTRAFQRDGAGHPIPGGSRIVDIIEAALTSSSWKRISMPDNTYCKQLLAGTRDQSNWRLSAVANGTTYKTMAGDMALEIAGVPLETLFYAQSVNATATLEVMLVD